MTWEQTTIALYLTTGLVATAHGWRKTTQEHDCGLDRLSGPEVVAVALCFLIIGFALWPVWFINDLRRS